MMRDDAWKTYESWRRFWLSGGDSNAIAALRFHGLRGALTMAGAACNRPCPRPRPPSFTNVELPIADAAIAEAASQVRRLLRVPPPTAVDAMRANDEAIRGHVFCSFLALVLQQEVIDGCRTAGLAVKWADLMRDLDRLQQADVELDGKHITARTPVVGQVGRVFQAVGVALPPNMRERAVQAGISKKCSTNTRCDGHNALISKKFSKRTVQVGLDGADRCAAPATPAPSARKA